jgi:hypothetical protein
MHHSRLERGWAALALAAVIGSLGACQNKSDTPASPAPTPPAPVAAAPKAATPPPAPAAKQLEWTDPPEWKRVKPSSSMRRASYEIPPVKGDKAPGELNVFVLGGDVESNITRWVDEFSGFDPKALVRHDRTVNDMAQAVVEIPKGTFSGGMNTITKSENYALLGAIVVTPAGHKYFFKLTGPSATVKAARAPFYKMLDGMHLEGQAPAAPASPGAASPTATSPAAAGTPTKAGDATKPSAPHAGKPVLEGATPAKK